MMSDDTIHSDFESARSATKFLLDGAIVDPRTVGVRLAENDSAKLHHFEMRIGMVILAHELEQAGVTLNPPTLEDFVRDDLASSRETALQAYLGIVQAIAEPKIKRSLIALFRGKQAGPEITTWIKHIERTYVDNESLVIAGVAVGPEQ